MPVHYRSSYQQLHVYDFDGTLFRSAARPPWWPLQNWWTHPDSLRPPCVPAVPPEDWWVGEVVTRLRQDMRNPRVLAVVVTARRESFRARIQTLLQDQGLLPDALYLSPGEEGTVPYKMGVIRALLKQYPSIRGVSIWEDHADNLRLFTDAVTATGRAAYSHLVTAGMNEVACSPGDYDLHRMAPRVAARYKQKKKIKNEDGEESTVYVYSERQQAHSDREKAKRVEGLRKQMGELRSQVHSDLTAKDVKKRLTALAISLIDKTCERVGNAESASNGHYGVTGFLRKHLKIKGDTATFTYVGKSGVKHEKTVNHAPTVQLLKELAEDKEPGDPLLSADDFTVTSSEVNEYLKPFEVTAKDIRGYRANTEMCRALKAQRAQGKALPRDRKEKDKILKAEFAKALEEVAEIVGHEDSTLRSQYLVPGIEENYLHDGTVIVELDERKASDSRRATKSQAEKEDDAAASLVRPPPKKKPPRHDLRKHRVDTEEKDPDTAADRDLSLNYKKVSSVQRVGMAVRLAARYLRAEKTPGEGDEAFARWHESREFLSQAGNQVDFDSLSSEQQTRIYEVWQQRRKTPGKSKEKDPEESEGEDPGGTKKQEEPPPGPSSEQLQSQTEEALQQLGQGGRTLTEESSKELKGIVESASQDLDPEGQRQLVSALHSTLTTALGAVEGAVSYGERVRALLKSSKGTGKSEKEDPEASRERVESAVSAHAEAVAARRARQDEVARELRDAEDETDRKKLRDEARRELQELYKAEKSARDAMVGTVAQHHLQTVVRDYLTDPEQGGESDSKDPHGEAWARYEALPAAHRARRLQRAQDLLRQRGPEDSDHPEHDASRKRLQAEVAAGKLHAIVKGDSKKGDGEDSDPAEELAAKIIRKTFGRVGPGDRHLLALAQGPDHPGYRAAVHNLLDTVPDSELEEVLGGRHKHFLSLLTEGPSDDDDEGGLTQNELSTVRKALINSVLDAAGGGSPEEDVVRSVGQSKGSAWWRRLRAWLKSRQKKPSLPAQGPYRSPGSVGDIVRVGRAPRWLPYRQV